MIRQLYLAGADAFRINMSHGTQADRAEIIGHIRALEREFERPMTILVDLQVPKLRIGTFANKSVELHKGATFTLDHDETPGDETRVNLPHRELFAALRNDARLLLNDGKMALRVTDAGPTRIVTKVEVGGELSNHKGLNVPDVVVPM